MLKLRLLYLLPALFLIWPDAALAQNQPTGSGIYTAGPYRLKITLDREQPRSAQDFLVTVERLEPPANSQPWQLEVDGLPNPGTSATPVKIEGNFQTGEPDRKHVKMQLPIAGNWNIRLTVKDSVGSWQARIPVKVEPPPVIAPWLAWLIGLSPVLGLLGFGVAQWRWVRQRRRSERLERAVEGA